MITRQGSSALLPRKRRVHLTGISRVARVKVQTTMYSSKCCPFANLRLVDVPYGCLVMIQVPFAKHDFLFNGTTLSLVLYNLASTSRVSFKVTNLLAPEIRQILDSENMTALYRCKLISLPTVLPTRSMLPGAAHIHGYSQKCYSNLLRIWASLGCSTLFTLFFRNVWARSGTT